MVSFFNETELEDVFLDPYTLLEDSTGFKVFSGLYFSIILITGSLLHIGIISYEKFGGDSRKRGIQNQVIKSMQPFQKNE